ncbi:MAG: hypothetical protein M1830_008715, partial [Pleopsidium flavum]
QRPGGEGTELADSGTSDHQSKKRKKHKKELATKNSNDGKAEFEVVAADAHHDADQDAENADVAKVGDAETAASKHQRFIVFIGNLPFTATTASITAHFSKVQPLSVRHRTHKTTGKSKGFAFLEFSGYDRMKTCLKLYHHSSFDDGLSPARKINVELTAGGGGAKSQERREKLQTKNEKLNEERKRRALEEEKVSRKANKKDAKVADVATEDAGDVHPSRRGRVPQG